MSLGRKALIYIVGIALSTLLVSATGAWADSSTTPHGTYVSSSELCGICHDTHEAPMRAAQRNQMPARIEDDSADITYTGAWAGVAGPDRSAGGSSESSQAAAKAVFIFDGSAVTWLATKTPASGRAAVYLDDVFQGTVDLYESTTAFQAEVFTKPGLPPGDHKIEIRVLRTKQAGSSGYDVDLDALGITIPKVMLLKNKDEKTVCYTCHNGTGSQFNVEKKFGESGGSSPSVSKHPVPQNTLMCSDCHSPHRRAEDWDETADQFEIVRLLRSIFQTFIGFVTRVPANFPAPIAANAQFGIPEQKRLARPYDQCAGCHGPGSTLPGGDVTKYYDAGGVKHDSTTTIPANAKSGIACMSCHEWHAADLPKLLETTIAGGIISGNNNSVCYACHVEPKIATYDNTASSQVHGAAESTKTPASPGLLAPYDYQMGQLPCNDCHNPHGTKNVFWVRPDVNAASGISIEGTAAADRAAWENFCAACHTYTHDTTSTFDLCSSCHFHGAGSDSTDGTRF